MLRTVTRAQVIAWRKDMELRKLAPHPPRRKLSALLSLFDYLCERIPSPAIRSMASSVPQRTRMRAAPALRDAQPRRLLDAPPADTLKGVRDRAILAALLYHGL